MTSRTLVTAVVKRAVCAVLRARLQLLQARLHTLRATIDAKTARLELRSCSTLAAQQRALNRAVTKLAVAGAGAWGRGRRGVEDRVAALEAAVHAVESRLRAR